jgi:DNA polymerase-3 subunit delta'
MAQGARLNWLDAAEKTHKAQYGFLLASMQRWVSDLQSVAQGGEPRYYPKHLTVLQSLSKLANVHRLHNFWKSLVQARRHENHPLANKIQLESLLSQYQQIFGP